MKDPRMKRLASTLVDYSCSVQRDEKVLIEAIDVPEQMVVELVKAVDAAGGLPFLTLKSATTSRALQMVASEEQMRLMGEFEVARMQEMNAYIGVRGSYNVSEHSDIPSERMKLFEQWVWTKTHLGVRVPKTKWVVLRWPHPSMAQLAQMSTEAFEDFYFDVCTFDYAKMSRAMKPLQDLMNETDRVRLVAPGTDLAFSIADIPAVCCDGQRNIPDGEVYTAPVRDSVNGTIQYNTPTIYHGVSHENIRLDFEQGKIVGAHSAQQERLDEVLDTDEGARYIGEFAIGFNPYIRKPMKDILFDEKIAGSLHFTPGQAYKEADNGNRSQIHWDLVLMMDPEAGGGEIYFDDRLIRKDGLFVVPELEALNPEQLMG